MKDWNGAIEFRAGRTLPPPLEESVSVERLTSSSPELYYKHSC